MPTETIRDTTRDLRPLYAAAGLTDLIAETLRKRLERSQGEAVQRWAELKQKTPRMPLALSAATRERITDLQDRAGRAMAGAESTYNQLAGRGRGAVDEAFGSARAFGQETGQRLVAGMPAPFDRATEMLRPVAQRWLGEGRGFEDEARATAPATESTGTKSTGTRSTGTRSTGTKSTGTRSTGTRSTGTKSTGTKSTGTRSTGTKSTGTKSTGTSSAGTKSAGRKSTGARSGVKAPAKATGGRSPSSRGRRTSTGSGS